MTVANTCSRHEWYLRPGRVIRNDAERKPEWHLTAARALIDRSFLFYHLSIRPLLIMTAMYIHELFAASTTQSRPVEASRPLSAKSRKKNEK